MDIHKNARLTLRSREALVEIVIRGLGVAAVPPPAFTSLPKPPPSGFAVISSEGACRIARPLLASASQSQSHFV